MNEEKNCPVGISNRKEIEKMKDVFTIMINNLNDTLGSLEATMEKKFNELNDKIDKVDVKIDTINSNLPDQINEVVDNKMKVGVFTIVKWVTISAAGVAITSVVAKLLGN